MPPTDPRFREMSIKQKWLAFYNYIESPEPELIRAMHQHQIQTVAEQAGFTDSVKDDLRKAGYNETQLRAIEEQLEIAYG